MVETILPCPVSNAHYTLKGKISGYAEVMFIGDGSINCVVVKYIDYSDDGTHVLDDWEDVELTISHSNVWGHKLDWYSDIIQRGLANASKKTSKGVSISPSMR